MTLEEAIQSLKESFKSAPNEYENRLTKSRDFTNLFTKRCSYDRNRKKDAL